MNDVELVGLLVVMLITFLGFAVIEQEITKLRNALDNKEDKHE